MSGHSLNVRKKYSARALSVGAVFCPACRRRLTDRDSDFCPACGFMGEDTMRIFRMAAPPLETISDHARLFSAKDEAVILKSIRQIRRQFPQIHWRVVTAVLRDDDDVGLFSFWLLNVSPLGKGEDDSMRPWTVLLVILDDGDVAVTPGYAAEVWLSGHDWSQLLRELHGEMRAKRYGRGIRDFFDRGSAFLENSWLVAKGRTEKRRTPAPPP